VAHKGSHSLTTECILMAATTASLKSALWDAANTLRGSAVDRTDWKAYILPLLFFKRICDCWDEETSRHTQLGALEGCRCCAS
jgi:type I restriction-modification system DNA methylase subunit